MQICISHAIANTCAGARVSAHCVTATLSHHNRSPSFVDVTAKVANPGFAPMGWGANQRWLFTGSWHPPTEIGKLNQVNLVTSHTHTLTHSHTHTHALKHRSDRVCYQSWARRLVLIVYICWSFKHFAWSPAVKLIIRCDCYLEKNQTLTL